MKLADKLILSTAASTIHLPGQRDIPNIVTLRFIASITVIIRFNCHIGVALICGSRHCNLAKMANMGCLWFLSCRFGKQQLYYISLCSYSFFGEGIANLKQFSAQAT
ncbi:hypothetical protein [Komarekiella delphini-convector]|uniref:hypothetical protein n=1 Tax=Komarekiella delphini-convector TaxID=3050158 RepID=UPI0017828545